MNGPTGSRDSVPFVGFVLSLISGLAMLVLGIAVGVSNRGETVRATLSDGGLEIRRVDWLTWPWLALILGLVIVISAWLLYSRPRENLVWGIVILVASLIGFATGTAGLLAGILGVIGAVLILTWRSTPAV